MEKKKSKAPFIILCVALAFVLIGLSFVTMARKYVRHEVKLSSGTSTLIHLFNRDTRDELETHDHTILLEYDGIKPNHVFLEYFMVGGKWESKEMSLAAGTTTFVTMLGKKPKPTRYFYRFRAFYDDNVEGLFTKSDTENFFITFEGKVPHLLYIAHVFLMIVTAILLFFSFYFILELLINRVSYIQGYWTTLCGFVVFLISSFPLGCPTSGYAFGEPFGAWPFGTDITDTKSFYLLLFWLVPLLLRIGTITKNPKHNKVSERTFGFLCMAVLILGLVAFIIPHSLFVHPQGI